MNDTGLFLIEWFKRCPEGGFLEIRIKRGFTTSEFFGKVEDAIGFVDRIKDVDGQNVWFGAHPRFKLSDAERVKHFHTKHKAKLLEQGSVVAEDSPEFEKTLLENYGELGGSREYVKYVTCRQLDFDCVDSAVGVGASDKDYVEMNKWADQVCVYIEDEKQSGFIIGSGNGIQLFLWLKTPKNIEDVLSKGNFEKQTEQVGGIILDVCPNPLVEYDGTTSEIARVMRLVGTRNPKGGRISKLIRHFVPTKAEPFNFRRARGSLASLLKKKIGKRHRYEHFVSVLGHLATKGVPHDEARSVLEKINKENCEEPAPGFYIDNAISSYGQWVAKADEKKTEREDEIKANAEYIVKTMEENGVKLFTDQFGSACARFEINGHHETHKLSSGVLKRYISWNVWNERDKALSNEMIKTAVNVLEGKAIHEGERYELNLRIAFHDGAVWYDLCDAEWRAIRIDAAGWEVVDNPPVLFIRRNHMKAQVIPEAGGRVQDVLKYQNIKDEDDRILSVIYLCTAFIPQIQHVIPILYGAQGSAKSTFFALNRALIDPSSIPLLKMPKDENEMCQQLYHHYCPFYDNISKVSEWQSDNICRAVSGQGFSKRQLFTDDDDFIYSFKRTCGLNGINVAGTKADLLDRAILVELERIPKSLRKSEIAFWKSFDVDKPKILGAVFDAVSVALRTREEVVLDELPRMADFAIWGEAFARALGYQYGEFIRRYEANIRKQNMEVIMGSTFGEIILEYLKDHDEFEGTATDMFKMVKTRAEALGISVKKDESLPQSPPWVTRKLNEIKTNLIDEGWIVVCKRSNGISKISVWRSGETRDGQRNL